MNKIITEILEIREFQFILRNGSTSKYLISNISNISQRETDE